MPTRKRHFWLKNGQNWLNSARFNLCFTFDKFGLQKLNLWVCMCVCVWKGRDGEEGREGDEGDLKAILPCAFTLESSLVWYFYSNRQTDEIQTFQASVPRRFQLIIKKIRSIRTLRFHVNIDCKFSFNHTAPLPGRALPTVIRAPPQLTRNFKFRIFSVVIGTKTGFQPPKNCDH